MDSKDLCRSLSILVVSDLDDIRFLLSPSVFLSLFFSTFLIVMIWVVGVVVVVS